MRIFSEKPETIDILISFIPALAIFILNKLIDFTFELNLSLKSYLTFQLVFILTINYIGSKLLTPYMKQFSVYWRSNLIANVMIIGVLISLQDSYFSVKSFGFYLLALSFFHLSEYLITLLSNYKSLNLKSFLINHSLEYNIAALASWIEFFIEVYFFPEMKNFPLMWTIGTFLIIIGEIVRKLAMHTAGTNFNHLVQSKKSTDHVLVKHGIYSIFRHPSYFGWFYWSIGTQILLANPVCIIAYTYTSWMFFKSRILSEEFYLIRFFGSEYIEYCKRVPIRIPFIHGYIEHDENLD